MKKKMGWWAGLLACTLAACGGGGSSGTDNGASGDIAAPAACDTPTRKRWMDDYFAHWYLWNHERPAAPAPLGADSLESYFSSLLHTGGATAPYADRWSFIEPTASFDQYFSAGQTLGYGLSVAGRMDDPVPVRVRYVAPGSPAETAGLRRGMVVVSIEGKAAESYRQADNAGFGPLSASTAGQIVHLQVKDSTAATTVRDVNLTAAAYALTPVATNRVVTTPGGRSVGYLLFTTFIDQARSPLNTALAQFKAAGVQDLVLDLRYNGGGLISVSRDLASAFAGPGHNGQRFARTHFNAEHASSDSDYPFAQNLTALPLSRVYVLTGPRTCSASELVINGLRGIDGIEVVQVGGTTCGKPFGFSPRSDSCGNTLNAVNFSMVNARDEGGYVNGLSAACPSGDDFDHALGDTAEGVLATALTHADGGGCTAAMSRALPTGASGGGLTRDGDERQGAF